VTATNAVFTTTVLRGDVTGTMTSVADADLLGTELLASLAAARRAPRASQERDQAHRLQGHKRYVNVKVSSTVTAATPISGRRGALQPERAPVSNP
jgi:hypothetical protein